MITTKKSTWYNSQKTNPLFQILFQFQSGAIKSTRYIVNEPISLLFQFQSGAIKSSLLA